MYNVTQGASVVLECTAEGEPPPEITWWENGVPVSGPSLFIIGRTFILIAWSLKIVNCIRGIDLKD